MTDAQAHAPSEHRDDLGAKVGMWLFLFTELILFGGLFILYSAYRSMHAHAFEDAGKLLDVPLGVTNTVVLLTSSLTVVLAIAYMQRGDRRKATAFLLATIGLALTFLVIKTIEWSAKFEHGIFPGSPHLLEKGPGETLFFGLYFLMTGLHGLHVIIGGILLTVMLWWVVKGKTTQDNYVYLENAGLYWHLVDVIWIFLLPLFYLAA